MSRTREALLRAEARHESRYKKSQVPLDIEQNLLPLNLSEKQLANQNLSELIQSLQSINACIKEPALTLESHFKEASLSRENIIPVLLKRKWLVLELIDVAANDKSKKISK